MLSQHVGAALPSFQPPSSRASDSSSVIVPVGHLAEDGLPPWPGRSSSADSDRDHAAGRREGFSGSAIRSIRITRAAFPSAMGSSTSSFPSAQTVGIGVAVCSTSLGDMVAFDVAPDGPARTQVRNGHTHQRTRTEDTSTGHKQRRQAEDTRRERSPSSGSGCRALYTHPTRLRSPVGKRGSGL